MSGDKDLIIQHYDGDAKVSPLVTPTSKLEREMYGEMARLNKQVKAIKKILEVSNEK